MQINIDITPEELKQLWTPDANQIKAWQAMNAEITSAFIRTTQEMTRNGLNVFSAFAKKDR